MEQQVRVGVGFYIFDPATGKFLVQERRGAHGAGTWAAPGGHQEFSESVEETAAREALEETGLVIDTNTISRLGFTDDYMPNEGKHYITLGMGAWLPLGQIPEIKEPHKASRMEWWDGKRDGRLIFISLRNFLDENPDVYGLFQSKLKLKKAA